MTQLPEQRVAARLGLNARSVAATIELLNGGATVPFIARYRKEATASANGIPLDEVEIGQIKDTYQKLLELDKRREAILKSIDEQGKLTPELRRKIEATDSLIDLEDLYLPYKQKRKTRAIIAIERGLEPLANVIIAQREPNIERTAQRYLSDAVPTVADALQGARDILAERISEDADARQRIRNLFEREAIIRSTVKKGKDVEGIKFKDYFDFAEPLRRVPSHRLLALRRGEAEGFLSVTIGPDEDAAIERLERQFIADRSGTPVCKDQVSLAIRDGYKRLLKPSLETEFANLSKEKADMEAIGIFADNLRQLLLSPPLGQQRVLAIDPGYRTGCKTVCLDAQGNLLTDTVLYLSQSEGQRQQAIQTVQKLVSQYTIGAIAIGNGTAGRETEEFVQSLNLTTASGEALPIFMVSEQGASIYSASEVARNEFPDRDVTVRGAVSIGRRLMDPLAELVKIDPKSIGVGQYQHDVDQTDLKTSLDTVVESCVNQVGVSLNTASAYLLRYVSGLGPQLAGNIVAYRAENGAFTSRDQLKKVPRLGPKAFEQCAGFLRIEGAKNPLDNSAVHPERYGVVERMATDAGSTVTDLIRRPELRQQIKPERYVTKDVGLPTLRDIVAELAKPGRDPREQLSVFEYDARVRSVDDLHEGMVLNGVVTNITAFGAFVDIGVKQDGLVHVSQLANHFVSDPKTVVKVYQKVKVKVMEVDKARKRIALSMKF
ncbi:S1 RNA-binding domain-containing protein [Spirosoma sp. HMF3257]|uniref:RNA-binding transcriptional accessory protein n=1 Tax=Spirosoma telluris TaxID=2183553 RepID=A0A327NSQ6_9BACT|nr:S1 RNA-binding domain-containing protein [Spirosoma telluris]RAI78421.1 RNA-binding transcriptional accessory protein [Spirosoma telluris]